MVEYRWNEYDGVFWEDGAREAHQHLAPSEMAEYVTQLEAGAEARAALLPQAIEALRAKCWKCKARRRHVSGGLECNLTREDCRIIAAYDALSKEASR